MKKILITGIAGFIGSATAKKLICEGYEVVGIDNFNNYYDPKIKRKRAEELIKIGAKIIEADLIDCNLNDVLKGIEVDSILHIAASAGVRPSIDQPDFFVKNNILVTTKILQWMKEREIENIVFASSSSVYGNLINSKAKPIKEEDIRHEIFSPYAATKLSCEAMIDTYVNLYKMNAISLRYFTVFGPDQRPDLAIIKFMRAIINGESIDKYGDGDTFRDYTFIEDVVDANIKSLKYNYSKPKDGKHWILNISSKNPISLNELVSQLEEVIGKKAIVNQMGMQLGDVVGTYGDNSLAKQVINWEPKTKFKDGLRKTEKWLMEK